MDCFSLGQENGLTTLSSLRAGGIRLQQVKRIMMELEHLSKCALCDSEDFSVIDNEHNICECGACGYVFDNPRPRAAEIAGYYSRSDKYAVWLSHEKGRDLLWKRRLGIIRRYKKSGSLLDIGAGIGQFLNYAKKSFTVYGTEVSQSAISIAREKYGIEVKMGEIEQAGFEDTQFDIITLFHVLEHVPYPQSTLAKVKSLLKKDGMVVIAVPNDLFSIRTFIIKLMRLLKRGKFKYFGKLGIRKLSLDGALPEIHLSHFRPGVLKTFLERNGFEIKSQRIDPYYSATGSAKIIHFAIYFLCWIMYRLLGMNIYPTQMVVARKK